MTVDPRNARQRAKGFWKKLAWGLYDTLFRDVPLLQDLDSLIDEEEHNERVIQEFWPNGGPISARADLDKWHKDIEKRSTEGQNVEDEISHMAPLFARYNWKPREGE